MDIARKFLQMGYTRSTRYALRPSGRKYSPSTGLEVPRTGKIWDGEKYRGARVFKDVWERVEADGRYEEERARWKVEVEGQGNKPNVGSDGKVTSGRSSRIGVKVEQEVENNGRGMGKHDHDPETNSQVEEREVKDDPSGRDPDREQLRSIKQKHTEDEEENEDDDDVVVKPAKRQKTSISSSGSTPKTQEKTKTKTRDTITSGSKRRTRSDGPVKVEPDE
jgi:hypothetical protein